MNYHDHSIKLLAEGFSDEFAKFVIDDERYTELLMLLAQTFVERNIPLVKEDDIIELAHELVLRL